MAFTDIIRIVHIILYVFLHKRQLGVGFITAKPLKIADPANKLMLMPSFEIAFN